LVRGYYDVASRTFCGIILCGVVLCGCGVLIDLDHWYAQIEGVAQFRWLHYTLADNGLVLVLLSMLWGTIVAAFKIGWDHLTSIKTRDPGDGIALHNPLYVPPISSLPRLQSWEDHSPTQKPSY